MFETRVMLIVENVFQLSLLVLAIPCCCYCDSDASLLTCLMTTKTKMTFCTVCEHTTI